MWVQVSGTPITDANGNVVGSIAVLTDITERRRAEELLADSHRQLQALFDNTQDGLLLANNEGRYIDANPAACKLLGYTREELLQMSTWDLTGTTNFGAAKDSWKCLNADEHAILTKGGERIDVEYRAVADTVPGVHLSVLRDISERVRLEKEILQICEKERRRIGEDLHDELGQELTGIAFLTKVLEDELITKRMVESEKAREIGKLLNRVITQLHELIKGLFPVRPEPEGLISALDELSGGVQKRFKIPCTFEYNKCVSFDGDEMAVQIYRIAQEAVNNAVKHAAANHISIRLTSDKDRTVLTVEDDGVGFPEGSAVKKGMGLSIMKHRARLIDAIFRVERVSEGGTLLSVSTRNRKARKRA